MWSTQGLPRELLDFAGGATIGGNLSWVSSTNFILAPRLDSGEPSTGAIGAAATRLAIVSAMASAGALCWSSLPLAAVLALHFITLINAASLHLSHGPNAPLVASFVLALAGARAGDAWSIDALVRRHWPSRDSWRRERIFSAGIPYKAAAGRDHGPGGDPSTRPSSEPAWYRPFIWRAAPALALLAVGFQYTNGGYPKLGSSPLLPHGGWTTDRNLVHSGLVIWYRETILHLATGYPLNYLTPRLPVLHDMLQEYTTLAAAPSLLAEHFAPVLFVGPGKLRAFTGIFFACFHSSIEMLMYIRHFRTTMCIVLALGLPAWWLRTPASDRGYARTGNAIDEESGQEGRGNNSTGVEDEHLVRNSNCCGRRRATTAWLHATLLVVGAAVLCASSARTAVCSSRRRLRELPMCRGPLNAGAVMFSAGPKFANSWYPGKKPLTVGRKSVSAFLKEAPATAVVVLVSPSEENADTASFRHSASVVEIDALAAAGAPPAGRVRSTPLRCSAAAPLRPLSDLAGPGSCSDEPLVAAALSQWCASSVCFRAMVPDAEAEQRLCAELLELAPAAASASLSRTGGANVSVTAAQVASVRVVASRVSRFYRPQMGLERLERSLPRIGMDNATSLLARTFDSASLLDRRPLFKSHHPKALRLAEQAVKNRDRHPILLECFRGDGVPPTHYEAMPVRDLRALATKTKSSKTKPRYLSKVRQCIGLGCVHPADRLLVEHKRAVVESAWRHGVGGAHGSDRLGRSGPYIA